MAYHNEIGIVGEKEAKLWLQKNGYSILETNWRYKHLEIDIIATNSKELVIAEVKTRKMNSIVSPEESVDGKKIKRLLDATEAYLELSQSDLPVRFDIICVSIDSRKRIYINHIEDAFSASPE